MKKIVSMLLSLVMLFSLLSFSVLADEKGWWENDVWEEDILLSLGAQLPDYDAATGEYHITTPEQLLYLSGYWKPGDSNNDGVADAPCDGIYVLDSDLDMAALNTSIGTELSKLSGSKVQGYMPPIAASVDKDQEEGIHCGFFGTFKGNGHVISNLRIVRAGAKYAGLFGNVGHDFGEGYVSDLAIVNAYVYGKANAGILCGSLQGNVDNCVVIGTVEVLEKTAGGIAGKVKKNDVGYESNVRNCFIWVDAIVRGQGSENGAAGGVTGAQSNGGRIYNCYVGGSILVEDTAASDVGGITGNLKNGQALENCVMMLKSIRTEGGINVGMLVGNYGSESGSHMLNNYVYDGTVVSGSPAYAHPATAAYSYVGKDKLTDESFYQDVVAWDFDNNWTFVKGELASYPMVKVFADNALVNLGIDAKVLDTFDLEGVAVQPEEPLSSTAYEGEPVLLSVNARTPDGSTVSGKVLYGTDKDPASYTQGIDLVDNQNGSFSVAIPELSVGTYYYVYELTAGKQTIRYPDAGSIRLDVVSADAKYAPKYLTVTPGETVTSVGLNFITEETGLTGEANYRLAGGSDWTVVATDDTVAEVRGTVYGSHSADITGLTPDTDYEYMVVSRDGDKVYRSDILNFHTLADTDSVSFIVISDMQGTSEEAYKPFLYTMNGFVQDQLGGVDFVVSLGDMTENDTASEWSYLFDTIGEILREKLMVYVPGNHEYKQTPTYENFKAMTNLPGGIQDDTIGETTGSFVVGDTCFVIMNTDPFTGLDGADVKADKVAYYEAQKAWAKVCFDASGCTWKVIVAHAGLIQDDEDATSFLENMCDELGVDLYFNGHIHNYYRANVYEGKHSTVGTGTAFVTSSPMGLKFDPYDGEIDDLLECQVGGSDDQRQYFTHVQVKGDEIVVTAYQRATDLEASKATCADYQVIDTFTLKKTAAPAQVEEPAQEPEAPAEETATTSAAPVAEAKHSTAPYIVGAVVLAAVCAAVVVVLKKKKK